MGKLTFKEVNGFGGYVKGRREWLEAVVGIIVLLAVGFMLILLASTFCHCAGSAEACEYSDEVIK